MAADGKRDRQTTCMGTAQWEGGGNSICRRRLVPVQSLLLRGALLFSMCKKENSYEYSFSPFQRLFTRICAAKHVNSVSI